MKAYLTVFLLLMILGNSHAIELNEYEFNDKIKIQSIANIDGKWHFKIYDYENKQRYSAVLGARRSPDGIGVELFDENTKRARVVTSKGVYMIEMIEREVPKVKSSFFTAPARGGSNSTVSVLPTDGGDASTVVDKEGVVLTVESKQPIKDLRAQAAAGSEEAKVALAERRKAKAEAVVSKAEKVSLKSESKVDGVSSKSTKSTKRSRRSAK